MVSEFSSAFEAGAESSICKTHRGTKEQHRPQTIRKPVTTTYQRRSEALDEAIQRAEADGAVGKTPDGVIERTKAGEAVAKIRDERAAGK